MADQRALRNLSLLPEGAANKFAQMQVEAMSCADTARSMAERLANLPSDAHPKMRNKLSDERERSSTRANQLTAVVNRCLQWLAELRPDAVLESVPSPPIDVASDQLADAIARVRLERGQLGAQLASIKSRPLPPADTKRLVDAYVGKMFQRAAPTVRIVNDELKVVWRGDVFSPDDTAALCAWLSPEAFTEALTSELKNQPMIGDALSASERKLRCREIQTKITALEIKEETMIMAAQTNGIEVMRRVDCDAAVLLGVTVASTQQQAAVA
jgi:hypothetical protein